MTAEAQCERIGRSTRASKEAPHDPTRHPGLDPRPWPPAPPYATEPPLNGLAVASLVLGLLWLNWFGSILALVLGYVAKRQIDQRGESGRGMALAGIILGWIGLAFLVLAVIAISIVTNPDFSFE